MSRSSRNPHAFPPDARKGLYDAIYQRRDIRSQFLPDPIPDEVLRRVLDAAHHAPSVGLMQPWNFIVVHDREIRRRVKNLFEKANSDAAARLEEPRRSKYQELKLEGILESALNLCVTCDHSRFGPFVIGRNTILETDLYSVCCAIQNLWLAARAEGIGVGWVSIVDNDLLREVLSIPPEITPVAYLCLGYVSSFPERPELETVGWLPRLPLEELIFRDRWGVRPAPPNVPG